MRDNKPVRLITFGQGGHTLYYGQGTTLSGYDRPDDFTGEGETIPDGTLALDKRDAIDTPEGYRWVLKGPMVNVDLPDGQIDACPAPSPLFASAVAENSYGTLLALNEAHSEPTAGPLDSVSISEYVAGWVARGARIGTYHNGQIVWEDK